MMLKEMDGAGVDRAIIVPPSWEGDRIDYALEAAAAYPDRFAVMGRIALDDPASRALLPRWLDHKGMIGIRLTFIGPHAIWLEDGTADWVWPAADQAGIPIMLHPRGNVDAIAQIARNHPKLTLIIDHMGLNHQVAKQGRTHDVIAQTASLAKYRNVSVKISSLPTYSLEAFPFRDLDEHIARIVDVFGAERCYWGTDLSHSYDRCSYAQRVTHITVHLTFLTQEQKRLIMGEAILAKLGWPQHSR